MDRNYTHSVLISLILWLSFSGVQTCKKRADISPELSPGTVVRKRDDGSISSVNQVDDMGRVHGIRVTYYADGRTIHSKVTVNHGRKHGPSLKYYANKQVFEHSSYEVGKKHGLTRKYYKNGNLQAELEYEHGRVNPGLKEYDKDGSLVTAYPDVVFREINQLASKNIIDLEMFCTEKRRSIKFYLLKHELTKTDRIYLITENASASMRFYLKPGDLLNERIEILTETYTDLGNILVRKHSYHLTAP
jgi:antitoxin component YwqK of YwqJK toxin-antitoxin module